MMTSDILVSSESDQPSQGMRIEDHDGCIHVGTVYETCHELHYSLIEIKPSFGKDPSMEVAKCRDLFWPVERFGEIALEPQKLTHSTALRARTVDNRVIAGVGLRLNPLLPGELVTWVNIGPQGRENSNYKFVFLATFDPPLKPEDEGIWVYCERLDLGRTARPQSKSSRAKGMILHDKFYRTRDASGQVILKDEDFTSHIDVPGIPNDQQPNSIMPVGHVIGALKSRPHVVVVRSLYHTVWGMKGHPPGVSRKSTSALGSLADSCTSARKLEIGVVFRKAASGS
ncbi:hypothetical protein F5B20DRAFT_59014 [Whalleya microplaca]|nr:hypothetical protein F5B20DRAFT_59014 [Whalleya microplaca]